MIYNKSVVLSSIDNSLKKAVLDLDGKAGNIKGNIKLYNFVEEPMGVLSLGFLIDGKVHKAGLTRVGYMSYIFGTNITSVPETCTCALISSKGGNFEPILLGAISGNSATMEQRLISGLSALEQTSSKSAGKILSDNAISFDDDAEIEQEIDDCFKDNNENCEKCVYKSVFFKEKNQSNKETIFAEKSDSKNTDKTGTNDRFGNIKNIFDVSEKKGFSNVSQNEKKNLSQSKYSNPQKFKRQNEENNEEETYKNINEGEQEEIVLPSNDKLREIKNGRLRKPADTSFYFFDEISSQLDMLFEKYPIDEVLCDIIPNSKWVKVDYDEKGKYYVVGLIYYESEVKYVCYGFPAMWTEKPPVDFNEKAQWLPIDVAEPHGQGYWITYQDALDGEMVKVDII